MKSMTGYGKGVSKTDNRELTVELKSVNHRFLDISAKMPRAFIAYEEAIRSTIAKFVARGHIDVFINYRLTNESDKTVSLDSSIAKSYVDAVGKIKADFPELRDDFSVSALLKCPEVLTLEQTDDDAEIIKKMLTDSLAEAIYNLNAMREAEGNRLKTDVLQKIGVIENLLQQIDALAPTVVNAYRDKLRQRVTAALENVQIDEAKLANEVCFFADKCCIDEETTRLAAHVASARKILQSAEPVGRQLDFLLQEFNRETNTICSKSADVKLTDVALQMKNELEKIREQIQNLE
ncbi:MAG: YicC family protein [Corallococcus sp.]|nr:YicC family protein [Corallococcus sp.]MCM1359142.1 YicC family protein [Corallococcus sp.]MCM1394532.1 YicC family protein [Corallococcus sp.]